MLRCHEWDISPLMLFHGSGAPEGDPTTVSLYIDYLDAAVARFLNAGIDAPYHEHLVDEMRETAGDLVLREVAIAIVYRFEPVYLNGHAGSFQHPNPLTFCPPAAMPEQFTKRRFHID